MGSFYLYCLHDYQPFVKTGKINLESVKIGCIFTLQKNRQIMTTVLESFEIGTPVKVQTPAGIVEGKIVHYYRGTNVNQFCVRFNYEGSGCNSIEQTFSKKTGALYMADYDKKGKFKIVK